MTERDTMDGSPAYVMKTLRDLAAQGKFQALDIATDADSDRPVIEINFQAGPIGEVGVNGCSIEDVIDVLVDRLAGFQHGAFVCVENQKAIDYLGVAKDWLFERTRRRQAQNVEGTAQPHVS